MSTSLASLLHLPSHSGGAEATAQSRALSRRLAKLSRRTRQVFLLSRLDDYSYAQIASLLEIDVPKVERDMARVLRHAQRHEAQPDDPVQEQANRWYVHLQSPAATASQRIEFRHWLDADAAHLTAFQVSEHSWRQLRAPAALLGATGWHHRKRRAGLLWCVLAAFVCGLMMTAEAFS
ncbi:sigma factor-like helix-turn-helix DNA-binding protein [Pseudomonas sp. JDS28PS106]|uniref:sigma factor-like helix-turn-helix DNA-binding protein n=1 Tax=Pseudomonas sp. JDS28PS106 TaxID=2497235 RepID=UPI002FD5BA7C